MIQYLGLWILMAFALNAWAWLTVLSARPGWKSLSFWTVILACLPLIGFVGWFLIGPHPARA